MLSFTDVDQVHRLVLFFQGRIQLPLSEQRRRPDCFDSERRLHRVKMKVRSRDNPLPQSASRWRASVDSDIPCPHVCLIEPVFHVTAIDAVGHRCGSIETGVPNQSA